MLAIKFAGDDIRENDHPILVAERFYHLLSGIGKSIIVKPPEAKYHAMITSLKNPYYE